MKKILVLILLLSSTNVLAQWHHIEKVTRVTVRGDYFYVKGSGVTGRECTDEANFYGTINHEASESGHDQYYSMALAAYTVGKGISCYIYGVRENGVCKMQNCYIK